MATERPAQGMDQIVRLSDFRHRRSRVYFTRAELSQLLSLYSSRVISGEWRDYAIDHAVGVAVFSVFRHTHDRPLFAIAKIAGRGGADWAVFGPKGRLGRAASLPEVLRLVADGPRLVSG